MKKAGGELPVIPERALPDRAECRLAPSPGRPVLCGEIARAKQWERDGSVRVDDRNDLTRRAHDVRPERDDLGVRRRAPAECRAEDPGVRLTEDIDLEVLAVAGAQIDAERAGSQRNLCLDVRAHRVERSAGQNSAKKRCLARRAQA